LAVIGFIISWIFFYYVIPKLIRHLFIDKIENKINNLFNRLSRIELKRFDNMIEMYNQLSIKILVKTTWKDRKIMKDNIIQSKSISHLEYSEYLNSIIISFSTSIHLIICWFTLFQFTIYVLIPTLFISIFTLFSIFMLPIYKTYYNIVNKNK
jgi:hypothetical protein